MPTAETLFLLVLSMLTIESADSIRSLFRHFLAGVSFVSVMLCIPVWNKDKISYLSIPLGYRMWQKENDSKLELAASM